MNQEQQFFKLENQMIHFEDKLAHVGNKISRVEDTLTSLENRISNVEVDVATIKTSFPHLMTKAEGKDLEVKIEKSRNSIIVWLIGLIFTSSVVNHFLFG